MANAKVVADAAQSGFGKGSDSKMVDKGKGVAAAGGSFPVSYYSCYFAV